MEANLAAFRSSDTGMLMGEFPSEISEFIQSARTALDQLSAREKLLEQRLAMNERAIDNELHKIQGLVDHFNSILSGADVQSWRNTTEALYKEGKEQVTSLQDTLGDIKKTLKVTCSHLDTTSNQIVKGISKTLNNLHTTELEQFAEDSTEQVKNTVNIAVQQLTEVHRWYHWKNLTVVFLLALFAAIFTGMFIDDEWPWESHKTVVKQRVAGQALLSTWQQLSLSDQQSILSNASTTG